MRSDETGEKEEGKGKIVNVRKLERKKSKAPNMGNG